VPEKLGCLGIAQAPIEKTPVYGAQSPRVEPPRTMGFNMAIRCVAIGGF
jgi:hypothetical protein